MDRVRALVRVSKYVGLLLASVLDAGGFGEWFMCSNLFDFDDHLFKFAVELQTLLHRGRHVNGAGLIYQCNLFKRQCAGDFRPFFKTGDQQCGGCCICQQTLI